MKLNLSNITSGYGAVAALNANFDAIETAVENTLSRDGSTPNEMLANLDMNGNDILNADTINTASLVINGTPVQPSTGVTVASAFQSYTFVATAGQTSFSVSPYTPYSASVQVEVNGLVLPPADISVSGTNVVIPACSLNDEVIIRRYINAPTAFPNANDVSFNQSGTVQTRSVQSKLRDVVSVKDFGAVGDGVADDTAAITTAIAACQAASQTSLFFPSGVYRIASTITLGAGGTKGIMFLGETATAQQGSNRPPVTFRWQGGASPMFDVQGTYFSFSNIAFENFTTATDVFLLTEAMHMVLDNCSFVLGSGTARFSRSVMYSDGNEFGYSVVKNCTIQNPAPRFLDIDGKGTGNGIVPVLFENNVIESNSGGAHTVVYIKDEGLDILTFRANTFNGQANEQLTIVDTTDTPISETISVLNFYDNEIDLVANTATDRCFRLTNVTNVNFWGNQVQGGGSVTAIGNLVNSTVTTFTGNNGSSISGPFWSCDANSRVYPGINKFNNANTNGIGSDPGTGKAGGVLQVVTATYSTQTALTTSYADLVSATITPLNKTSKILVIANVNGLSVTGTTTTIQARINQGATTLLDIEKEAGYAGAVTTELAIGGIGATCMDAPSSTSALTYKIQIQKTGGSSAFANTSAGSSTITVMEVAA